MKTTIDKTQEQQHATIQRVHQEPGTGGTTTIEDNRPSTVYQRKLRETMHEHAASKALPVQRKKNNTGLPDTLKTGIENLSGYAMDDVKVHYNSSKPTQLQAHAYAQGTDIHLEPGQEKHLPHEAWHVVQQKQGRVKPTRQLKSKVNINDDAGLEKEADVMGAKALHNRNTNNNNGVEALASPIIQRQIVQRRVITGDPDIDTLAENLYEADDILPFDDHDRQGAGLGTRITGNRGMVIHCQIRPAAPISFNQAKEWLRNTDVERNDLFHRLGKPSINKQAYRLGYEPWVALVVPNTTANLEGVRTKQDKLGDEVRELQNIDNIPLDTPDIGDGELIPCLKNGVPATGFIQELIRGKELEKALHRVDNDAFIDYIINDITSSISFDTAKAKYTNARSSVDRIKGHIVDGKKVIHDFQLFYQNFTGKLLVFDPGDPGAPNPTRDTKVKQFVERLYKDLMDERTINRKWNRIHRENKKRNRDWL